VDTLSTERPDGLDHLYVSSFNNNNPSQSAIYVFDNASTIQGTVTPIQNISGPTTGLNLPFGIVVDTTR
jgi:hypothetical protein